MIHPMPSKRYGPVDPDRSDMKISVETAVSNSHINPKQCRICLEEEKSTTSLISPCKCAGSVKYVHEECLRKWVRSLIINKPRDAQTSIVRNGMECEMCKQNIKFEIQSTIACKDCVEIYDKIKAKTTLFLILVVLVLVAITGITFSIHTIVDGKLSFKGGVKGSTFQLILAVSGILLLFLFLLVGCYTIATEFLLVKKFRIGAIVQPKRSSNIQSTMLNIVDVQ